MLAAPLAVNAVGLVGALVVAVAACVPPAGAGGPAGSNPLLVMAAAAALWELVLVLDGTLVAALFARASSRAAPATAASAVAVAAASNVTSVSTGTTAAAAAAAAVSAAAKTVVVRPDLGGVVQFVDGDPLFQAVCETEAFIYKFISNTLFAANACLAMELLYTLSQFGASFSRWSDRSFRTAAYMVVSFVIPIGLNAVQTATRASKYVYQFIIFEIAWDVFFFAVGLFYLKSELKTNATVHAIIAYYSKHQYMSDSATSAESNPVSRLPARAAPAGAGGTTSAANPSALRVILLFVLRMTIWCTGISVLALFFFVSSTRTAYNLYLTGGPFQTVGVQSGSVALNVWIPGVTSCLMFLCFGWVCVPTNATHVCSFNETTLFSRPNELKRLTVASPDARAPGRVVGDLCLALWLNYSWYRVECFSDLFPLQESFSYYRPTLRYPKKQNEFTQEHSTDTASTDAPTVDLLLTPITSTAISRDTNSSKPPPLLHSWGPPVRTTTTPVATTAPVNLFGPFAGNGGTPVAATIHGGRGRAGSESAVWAADVGDVLPPAGAAVPLWDARWAMGGALSSSVAMSYRSSELERPPPIPSSSVQVSSPWTDSP
ncbi:hypothetical protein DFJ73DRAFT_768050 [Zopfochytrium polystomum]|nr:hypothetical protein DFJ73DRAFT_768050 [Zopfochytrium polystomum]